MKVHVLTLHSSKDAKNPEDKLVGVFTSQTMCEYIATYYPVPAHHHLEYTSCELNEETP